ncbi:unnamed protein product, partial [Symbiodinium pilosum]
ASASKSGEHLRSAQSLRVSGSGPPPEVPDHERDLLAKLPHEQLLKEVRSRHTSEDTPSPLQLLDINRQWLQPRDLPRSAVLVHVYNLNEAFVKANSLLSVATVGSFGAFHVGVEVFQGEWSYGLYGVSVSAPRTQTRHVYKCSVLLGETELNEAQFAGTLRKAFQEFMGDDYEIVGHNCCSFGRFLVKELGVGPMPAWVDRLARGLKSVGRATGRVSEHMGRVVATGAKAVVGAAAALRLGRREDSEEEIEDPPAPVSTEGKLTGDAGPAPLLPPQHIALPQPVNGWPRMRQEPSRNPVSTPGAAGSNARWSPPGVVVHRQVGYPPMMVRPGQN